MRVATAVAPAHEVGTITSAGQTNILLISLRVDFINRAQCRGAPFAVYFSVDVLAQGSLVNMTLNPVSSHSLGGLFKHLSREEWRVPFNATLDRHLRRACDTFELEADEIVSILGENYFMTTVWGCAFEDFLTQETDDGRNIVDDYLKRRGWKESASNRAYMQALRHSVISLYEVSNIVPETSFLARDLVRGGEPILISERSATRSLKQWDRIAARVLPIGSKTVISGAVLPFTIDASETLLKILRSAGKRAAKERHKLASLVGGDPDDPRIGQALSDVVVVLQMGAPAITAVWLNNILEHRLNPRQPDVRNGDGDELVFCRLHFPFADAVSSDDIRSVLNERPELSRESDTFWNWIAVGEEAASKQAKKKPKSGCLQLLSTTGDQGTLVLGNLEIKDRTLLVSVNSKERAERARALFSEAFGARIGPPLTEIQSFEQLMATRSAAPRTVPDSLDPSPEQRRSIVHQSMDKHYRRMLDEPVPMLGNRSPRKAVKTDVGREKVVAWLKTLENHSANIGDPNDPMATYDFSWLWAELGVSALQR